MKEREKEIFTALDRATPSEVFFLPYRDDPYRFLVSVILSASSADRMAVISSERLFERFPDVSDVAEADEEEIEVLIHSSGLSKTKACTIKRVSQYIRDNGLPKTKEELLGIKGIGEKTAACYAQHVLSLPAVVVDTHFERVSYRLGLSSSHDREKTMREIEKSFDSPCWSRLSDCVNYLGRTICRPRPECGRCFLEEKCRKRFD